MGRQQLKTSGIKENQKHMIPLKEYSNFPVTDPKEMEICDFPDNVQNSCFRKLSYKKTHKILTKLGKPYMNRTESIAQRQKS